MERNNHALANLEASNVAANLDDLGNALVPECVRPLEWCVPKDPTREALGQTIAQEVQRRPAKGRLSSQYLSIQVAASDRQRSDDRLAWSLELRRFAVTPGEATGAYEVECFHLPSMDAPPRAWYPPSVQNRIALGAKRVGELFSREAFTLAATAGSFSAAAKRLNVNVSSIARAVERLESSLGARLFARSTHGIALTEAGRLYLTHCQHLLASEQGVRDAINSARDEGGGTLRVALPVFLAERVAAAVIAQVRDSHPAAQFDVHASDENVDLVAGAFDLGVRLGPLADSALRTRRITSLSRSLYIAKKAHWAPLKTPKDLTKVPCLCYGNGSGPVKWSFRHQGRREDISLTPLVRTNHLTLLIALAEAGQGVALLPDWASQGVRGLTAVLAEWCQLPKHLEPALYAVFPHDRGKARLREAFIEGITRALSAAV